MLASLPCFGSDLDAHLYDQHQKLGSDAHPYVLSGADPFLRGALKTPGLFRTDCEPDELSALRGRVEAAYASRRKLDLTTLTNNWHAAAGLVKLYLRELPKPLLGFELYPYFLACGNGAGDSLSKLSEAAGLLSRLPQSAFRSISLVLALLHDTSVHNPVMTAVELSKIFAPLLLRPQAGAMTPEQRAQAEAAVALMISNGKPDGALLTSAQSSQPSGTVDALGRQMSRTSVSAGASGALPESTQWYYIDAQQNYVGPVDSNGLRQLRQHSYVNNDTYVWAEQLSGWQRLSSLPEFAEAQPPSMPPMPPMPPMPTPAGAPAAPAAPAAPVPLQSAPVGGIAIGAGAAGGAVGPTEDAGARRTGSVACASAAAPVLGCRSTATSAVSGAGVAAPPSLGLAVQRRRQESNPAGGAKPAAAPINLASAAMRPTLAGGASGGTLPLASPASVVGGSAPAPPPPALMPVPDTSGASAAAAPPSPRTQKGVNIPPPKSAPLKSSEGEWDDRRGIRLLATGAGSNVVRAVIKEDGEVADGEGTLLAYIEANGEVGDASMNFVGKALESAGQVVDASDAMVGEFDLGRGYIKDGQGSVIAEIGKEGFITNNSGQGVGKVEGFSFNHVTTLAAYFLLVDTGFLRASGRGYGAR